MPLTAGRKLGFSLAEYAKLHHNNIGSVRLKDGSSLKVIGSQGNDMIELYRVKNNTLYGGTVYKGKNSVFKAAQEFCAITEKNAVDEKEANTAWEAVCKYFHPDLI